MWGRGTVELLVRKGYYNTMNQGSFSKVVYGVIFVVVVALVGGYFFLSQKSVTQWPPDNVVMEPGESGQWVLVNELVILASGQDIKSLVAEFGGEITVSVPETDTYQVKFSVSTLEDLDIIAGKLQEKERGIQVIHSIVMEPPIPGEPQ